MLTKLTPRLKACAECVSENAYLLDVGTDHAHLPCFLIEAGKAWRACASDIADGPLAAARETVSEKGLDGKITVLKSDGLKDVPPGILKDVTDVVIAGMGGEMICKILDEMPQMVRNVNLVLQPNTRVPVLRRYLHKRGIAMLNERAVRDGGFIYVVISARLGEDLKDRSDEPDDFEAEVGRLDPHDATAREYLMAEASRLMAAAEGMRGSKSEKMREEAEKIAALSNKIVEFAGNAAAGKDGKHA